MIKENLQVKLITKYLLLFFIFKQLCQLLKQQKKD